MRRLELTWDDGAWGGDIAELLVEEIMHALDNPTLVKLSWQRPDTIRVLENAPGGLVPFASPDLLAALSEHDGTDPTTEEET